MPAMITQEDLRNAVDGQTMLDWVLHDLQKMFKNREQLAVAEVCLL